MASGSRLVAIVIGLAVGCCCPRAAQGQIHYFDAAPALGRFSLHALTLFYTSAPGEKGSSMARFSGLRAAAKVCETNEDENTGIQVGLLPWDIFWDVVYPEMFCNPNTRKFKPLDSSSKEVHIVGVPCMPQEHTEVRLQGGVYALVVINCGDASAGVFGKVSVLNPHGYLPANEHPRLRVHVGALISYILEAIAWGVLMYSRASHLLPIHYGLLCVLLMGVVESAFLLMGLEEMNRTGEAQALLSVGNGAAAFKGAAALTVVLAMALGAGVSRGPGGRFSPSVDDETKNKLTSMFMFVLITGTLKNRVFAVRAMFSPPAWIVGLPVLALAVALLTAYIMILQGFAKTLAELKIHNSSRELIFYQRSAGLFAVSAIGVIFALLAQLLDTPGRGPFWWGYHWFWDDAASQLFFVVMCGVAMMLWAPQEEPLILPRRSEDEKFELKQSADDEEERLLELQEEDVAGSPVVNLTGVDRIGEEDCAGNDDERQEQRGPTAQTIGATDEETVLL